MSNPETHTCHDCGYVWTHGQHGGHSCIGRLQIQRDTLLEACVNLENDDGAIDATSWNMIQSAVAAAGGTPKEIPEKTMREGYRLRLRMRETDALARTLNARFGIARACLESIVTDLPTNRDWLNPDTEKVARILLETTK